MADDRLSRAELHQALDTLLDELENDDAMPRERIWCWVQAAFGQLIQTGLHDDAQDELRARGIDPEAATDNPNFLRVKYHQALLARFVLEAAPVLPANFNVQAIVADLLAFIGSKDSKISKGPGQILDVRAGEKSHHPGYWLKQNARRAFVLEVISRAARDGVSQSTALERLGTRMDENLWRRWKNLVSKSDRAAAHQTLPAMTDDDVQRCYQLGYGQAFAQGV